MRVHCIEVLKMQRKPFLLIGTSSRHFLTEVMNIFQTFGRLAAIPESNMGLIQLETVAGMSFS